MAGRGPRVGATGLVGLLGLVLAFILTTSLPFLGLPWFIIAAAAIGGATYGVHRRLRVQLVTHHDIDAFTKREELVAAARLPRIPVESLTNADALRAELLRVMKEMGEVEVALNARVKDLESRLEAVTRERAALKARHEAMEAKAGDVEAREKATAALAAALEARGAEVAKGEEEVKASAVLLTRETDRGAAELGETRSRERGLARKEEELARRETDLARARKDVEVLQEAALQGKGRLL